MSLLTLAYRPRRFAELTGQGPARAVLQALVHSQDIPPALLFRGSSGTGKTSAARVFAAALNCAQSKNGDCCGVCQSCTDIQAGKSFAVHEVDSASNGGVEDIRALKDLTTYSVGSPWRAILLDEAHSLSRQAFNALLKILEEPPAHTVFVLLTTEPDKIMPTVRSRSMPIDFRPIPLKEICTRLQEICKKEDIHLMSEVLVEAATVARGSLREAVMAVDQARRVGATHLEAFRELMGISNCPAQIAKAIVVSDFVGAKQALTEFFAQSADTAVLVNGLLSELQERFFSNLIPRKQMLAATKLLWDSRTSLDQRPQIEALVMMLCSLFQENAVTPVVPQAPTSILRVDAKKFQKSPPSTPEEEMSLDELVRLASE